jgi:hypothetical protein
MSEGYTVKELLDELRDETKEQSTVLTRVCTSLEGIEKHLAQLNSKVATHEKRHNDFEVFKTRASIVFSIIIFFAVIAVDRVIAYLGL